MVIAKEHMPFFKLGVQAGLNKTFKIKNKSYSYCKGCERIKEVSLFYFREDGKLNKTCKACVCKMRRERYTPITKKYKWE